MGCTYMYILVNRNWSLTEMSMKQFFKGTVISPKVISPFAFCLCLLSPPSAQSSSPWFCPLHPPLFSPSYLPSPSLFLSPTPSFPYLFLLVTFSFFCKSFRHFSPCWARTATTNFTKNPSISCTAHEMMLFSRQTVEVRCSALSIFIYDDGKHDAGDTKNRFAFWRSQICLNCLWMENHLSH